ncbi:hypothetical protein PA39016_001380057 [Pseudomonas aeruginosa 39016]|nr:hypothetical protein PA39016_001380057 [Pseudomonas aeruginosa 39016]
MGAQLVEGWRGEVETVRHGSSRCGRDAETKGGGPETRPPPRATPSRSA